MGYLIRAGRLRALLHDAMDNLNAVRHRSLLSLLGIVIGTASVIALLNIGESASDEAMRQFTMMGTDLIVVQDNILGDFLRKAKPLVLHDAADLQREVRGVVASIPLSNYSVKTSRLAGGEDRVSIGATEGFLSAARLQLDHGRFVRDSDGYDTVVVLGSETAKALNTRGEALKLGDKVRMDAYLYTVVGVLKGAPKNPLLPFDIDNAFVVPVKSNRRMLMAVSGVSNVLLRVGEGYDPLVVLSDVSKFLQQKGKAAQAQGALQLIEGMRKQSQLFTWMLVGIASISLLVGGIGVMNVMLAGLAERKKEIGLRLAIGADRISIMMMVVCESTVLSVVGGAVGVVLGVCSAILFALFSGWAFFLSPLSIVLGVGVSILTGLFFGVYPALKASRMSPVEALRSE